MLGMVHDEVGIVTEAVGNPEEHCGNTGAVAGKVEDIGQAKNVVGAGAVGW